MDDKEVIRVLLSRQYNISELWREMISLLILLKKMSLAH